MKKLLQAGYVFVIVFGLALLPLAYASEIGIFSTMSAIGNSSSNDLDGLFKDHSCEFTIAGTQTITVNIQGNLGDTGQTNFINALSSDHSIDPVDRDTWKKEISNVLMKNMLVRCVTNCDAFGNTVSAYCRSK